MFSFALSQCLLNRPIVVSRQIAIIDHDKLVQSAEKGGNADVVVQIIGDKKEKAPKRWIQTMKYSPEGSILAVGSHDRNIYLYDAQGGYSHIATCQRHSSYITHIDFGVLLTNKEEAKAAHNYRVGTDGKLYSLGSK